MALQYLLNFIWPCFKSLLCYSWEASCTKMSKLMQINLTVFIVRQSILIQHLLLSLIIERFKSSCPDVFYKKGVPRNFVKFTGKHLCQSFFLNKVAGLRPATLLKKRFCHRCFLVNFSKFLNTPFLTEHLYWLLLKVKITGIAQSENSVYNSIYATQLLHQQKIPHANLEIASHISLS